MRGQLAHLRSGVFWSERPVHQARYSPASAVVIVPSESGATPSAISVSPVASTARNAISSGVFFCTASSVVINR